MICRWYAFPVLLLLFGITSTTLAFAEPVLRFGTVSTTELNLRPLPETSNTPIARLKSGDVVAILKEKDGWLRVRTLVSQQTGWVSSRYISTTGGTAERERPATVVPRPTLRLPDPFSVRVTDFSCDEGIFDDGGYKGCSVEMSVSIEIPTLYAAFLKDSIDLRCSTTVKYRTQDGFIEQTSYESGYVYVSIYNGSGYDSVTMEHSFGLTFEPVVRARLGEASCDFS
ncbi:SH3 domain-containing protein [Litoreibacter halocynthiae]|uniref:SH3 domain-containing protein n=1 Tax=Litoreibacter halocynthiae TaxID=1242689 RepID=A0A4R7LI14_9RHOB|nr:SH3 domain-containing protein [Litoreibacter halocynthiae]TDT73630.1 SH3 domain-containing protein [Litoreibacter halocynthiae]